MTLTSKLLHGLACFSVLGLIWALTDIVAQSSSQARAAGLSTPKPQSRALPRITPASSEDVAPGWVFTLRADAKDDPESSRTTLASIVFEGAVHTCTDPHPKARFGLAVDRTGTSAAHARREQRICLPGCDGRPPAATTRPLARHLDLTAFQEQFDRAGAEYAPEGRIAVVQWQCNGKISRLIAAAAVALACNSAECDDVQVANAAVHLGYDSGRALDEPHALFVLRTVSGGFAVASASSAPVR